MDQILEQMLKQLQRKESIDHENSLKEVVQEIVLCGLSRAGFFKKAAFYGGTALRLFHGLNRFSEDLDFSLKHPDPLFELSVFLPALEKEIRSYGLNFRAEVKNKSVDSDIKSAFLKGNTKEHMLMFYADEKRKRPIGPGELIKIKLEVDINPPDFASFETQYKTLPVPYETCLYDMPSLFAGKIHAVICRSWKRRVKGRDLYDFVFYLSRETAVNLRHLAARLQQSGLVTDPEEFSIEDVKRLLQERFENIDYDQAKQDVLPFINNSGELDVWKADFFNGIASNLMSSD